MGFPGQGRVSLMEGNGCTSTCCVHQRIIGIEKSEGGLVYACVHVQCVCVRMMVMLTMGRIQLVTGTSNWSSQKGLDNLFEGKGHV